MSYQGKRHYAYIAALEQLSLERENMQLDSKGKHRGVNHSGRTRRGRYLKKNRLEKQRECERRERREREQVDRAEKIFGNGDLKLKVQDEKARELYELAERLRPYVAESLRQHQRPPSDCQWDKPVSTLVPAPKPKTEANPERFSWEQVIRSGELNFHGGISYSLNPLDTLKMVSASSIFGEPQYYRDGEAARSTAMASVPPRARVRVRSYFALLDHFRGLTTAQVMERVIDRALDADFGATLEWAVELREFYQMRLNSQVILVRAAAHPGRQAWTQEHPGEFSRICQRVMPRGDDVTNQVQYWLASHNGKQGIPAILKRVWASRVGSMDAYSMAKYSNAGIGLIDVVRICHAKGPLVDTLMRKGSVPMPEGQNTWERLRSSGMGWAEILRTIRMPHMALLRNLRGIFYEVDDPQVREDALNLLKRGVSRGRQFPFRYLSAWKAAEEACAPWTRQVQSALEECMGIACNNLPRLAGRSAFLTDVSGSMWDTFTSAYGSVEMSEIANLSSVIGAMRADEGVVFPFATRMKRVPIYKNGGVLEQARLVGEIGIGCGCGTDNPFQLFFGEALERNEHWDNIFVYSDMQAGHDSVHLFVGYGCGVTVSSPELVELYRRRVNPKVNVYCIQLGGYTNSLLPKYGYRSTNLTGWTGKELVFADAMNRAWDEVDGRGPEQS